MIQLERIMSKEEFKERRTRYGITQNDLALRIGVATVTVARWEQGHQMIPRWVRTWFRGEYGDDIPTLYAGLVINWWGNRNIPVPCADPDPNDTLARCRKIANLDHWSVVVHGPTAIIIERAQ